jgi:hypothetical protein
MVKKAESQIVTRAEQTSNDPGRGVMIDVEMS